MERSRCLVLDTDVQKSDPPPFPHENCYSKFVEDYGQQGSDNTQFTERYN